MLAVERDGARRQRVVLLARPSACTARQQRTPFLLEGLKQASTRARSSDALRNTGYDREMWTGLYGVVHPYLSVWRPGRLVAGIAGITLVGLALAAVPRAPRPRDAGRRPGGPQPTRPRASVPPAG